MKKKIFCLFLVAVFVLSTLFTAGASNLGRDFIGEEFVELYNRTGQMRLAVMDFTHEAVLHSTQNLSLQKQVVMNMPEEFGFTQSEVYNMQLGTPFSIYVFDDSRVQIDTGVLIFPVVYNGNIIGILETMYDDALGERFFSFGRSYADELNALQQTRYANRDFVIVNYGDVLFASNGENVIVISDRRFDDSEDQLHCIVSEDEINYLAFSVISRAHLEFADVTLPAVVSFSEVIPDIDSISDMASPMNSSNFRLLDVRHVPQNRTGVCGVASWASILNFRFFTNYCNTSLAVAMQNAGIIATEHSTPGMHNYRDYANRLYNANAVFTLSPFSITQVRSLIDSRRPIMGNWRQHDNAGNYMGNHSLNIIGYEVPFGANVAFYFVRNPWGSTPHIQSLTVNHSNPTRVVHMHEGISWTLRESVH